MLHVHPLLGNVLLNEALRQALEMQVVATINYYTVAVFNNVQALHNNIFSLSAPVFTGLQHGDYNSLTETHTQNSTHK
jgi:hypothetical protein